MSGFNGTGTFNISGVGLPFATGTTISSTVVNQLDTDLASGLTNCICKDGQSTCTAAIPFSLGWTAPGVTLSPDTGSGSSLTLTGLTESTTISQGGINFNAAVTTWVIWNQSNIGVGLVSGATSWSAASDERIKTDLAPITDGLEKVGTLRAMTGRYRLDEPSKSRSFLIAQDVLKVLPQAVSEDKDGILQLAMTDVVPLLVAAIKELKDKVAVLEAR